MLDHETGYHQTFAKRFKEPATLAARIRALPGNLQPVAQTLVQRFVNVKTEMPEGLWELSNSELEKIFEVFFGQWSAAAVETWQEIACGPYLKLRYMMPFRSQHSPQVVRANQWDWLVNLLELILFYPPELTTPAALLASAPYFDYLAPDPVNDYGVTRSHDSLSAHIGRWLAKCVDQNTELRQTAGETFQQTIQGTHPQSIFGRHTIYSCWCSNHPDLQQLIEAAFLASEPLRRACIAVSASASEPERLLQMLKLVRRVPTTKNKLLGEMVITWFGMEAEDYQAKEFPGLVDQAVAALERLLETPSDKRAGFPRDVHDQLWDVWARMTREVVDVVPQLLQLMQYPSSDIRQRCLQLAIAADHTCMTPVFEAGLEDEHASIATIALSQWLLILPKELSAEKRQEYLAKVADFCRRIYPLRDQLTEEQCEMFCGSITFGIDRLWDRGTLTMFGPELKDRMFEFEPRLPEDFVAADDFTTEVLLSHVKEHCDTLALRLHASPLKIEHWAELFQKKAGFKSPTSIYLSTFEKRGPDSFREVMIGTLAHGKSRVRCQAMQLLLEATGIAMLSSVAKELIPQWMDFKPKGKVSEEEASLRSQLKRQSSALPPASPPSDAVKQANRDQKQSQADKLALRVTELVNYASLDGQVAYEHRTPAWQPVYKRLERFPPSCMQLMQSLDEFIEHNKERLMAEKPTSARTITLLEHWTPGEWPESYKQAWLGWWRDTGQALAQPGDLARLATLWTIVSFLDRGALPDTLDQSRLKELSFYNLYDIFPAPKASSRPVPDDEVTRFLRARMNPTVLWQVQYFLFEHVGTADDYTFIQDMIESIRAATPPGLYDYLKLHPIPNISNPIPLDGWERALGHMKLKVKPQVPPDKAYRASNRGIKTSLFAYGDGYATLGDVIHSIVKMAFATTDLFAYEPIANIRRSPERAAQWQHFYDYVMDSLLETELNRPADQPSEWSGLANNAGYLEGYQRFERMLLALAPKGFARPSKKLTDLHSHWTTITTYIFPAPGCDFQQVAQRLKQLLKEKQLTRQYLLEAALLAPQWAAPIGQALDWPSLPHVVQWLDCHVSTDQHAPSVDLAIWLAPANDQLRHKHDKEGYELFTLYDWFEAWKKNRHDKIRKPSFQPAVFVSWFHEIANQVSDEQWDKLLQALTVWSTPKKIASLQTVVAALRGRSDREALLSELQTTKKGIDARPLALLPLAQGKQASRDLLERYRALSEYRQRCRKFHDGESDRDNADYALDLLALQAGVTDLEGLQWKIQAAAADQFEEQRKFSSGDIEVTLSVNELGQPGRVITKAGKVIKSLPANLKEDKQLVAQQEMLKSLQKFATQSQAIFDEAIKEQRAFGLPQLQEMLAHPVLSQMVAGLLFTDGTYIGLLDEQAKSLLTRDDGAVALPSQVQLRLIHPVHLTEHGGWISWRDWLRSQNKTQAIPQVERGVFLLEYLAHNDPAVTPKEKLHELFGYMHDLGKYPRGLAKRGWTNDGDETTWRRELPRLRAIAVLNENCGKLSLNFMQARNGFFNYCDLSDVSPIDLSECARDGFLTRLEGLDYRWIQKPDEVKLAITEHVAQRSLANVHHEDHCVRIQGRIGEYIIDVPGREIRMLPCQYVPWFTFGPERPQALLAAIDQLSDPERELTMLKRLKMI